MDLDPDFSDLLVEFARAEVSYVLVGGYAVAFHGRPRATKDIDLLLAGKKDNLARAADALAAFGAPRVVCDGVRNLEPHQIAFLGQPPLRVDFLRSIDGVDADDVFARAVPAVVGGASIKVISLDDLITNKRAAGRPQDLVDADYLERVRARARSLALLPGVSAARENRLEV